MFMFSRGQIERMNATLAGPRASLAVSNGLVAPGETDAAGARERVRDQNLLLAFAARPQKAFDGVDWG